MTIRRRGIRPRWFTQKWIRTAAGVGLAAGIVWGCGGDASLREYLSVRFWSPFTKTAQHFEKPGVARATVAYAGMTKADDTPLGRARGAYQQISVPSENPPDVTAQRAALAEARNAPGLSARDREELDLIDAKIDLRADALDASRMKLDAFLRSARTPEFLSEARGWLARVHFLQGEQLAAGRIYLDELNRAGSNLSRETLLNSLQMNYSRSDGAPREQDLEQYFDTPEHAAFAITLLTNPDRRYKWPDEPRGVPAPVFPRVKQLLAQHADLLQHGGDSSQLTILSLRTALRMGDPKGAIEIAAMVPQGSLVRDDPEFLWMLAASRFVTRDYAGAEAPLLRMFTELKDTDTRKGAAAYGLCGVYQKLGRPAEQLRYALWLDRTTAPDDVAYFSTGDASERNYGIYWAMSGFDLNLLLEVEAPDSALEEFIRANPRASNLRQVKYALAVRYARQNRYAESAALYESIGQRRRGPRMRELARLWADGSNRAKVEMAQLLSAHSNGVYFNDNLWYGMQRYALVAEGETRFTKEEREAQIARERQLRDDQEEFWRAYRLLDEVVKSEGHTQLGEDAARLAIRCLRRIITDRFGRAEEIAAADIRLSLWLKSKG